MSFVQRLIDTIFVLGQGNFGEDGENQVNVSGLRVSADILNAGGRSMGTADIRIYGLADSIVNKLSTLGFVATMLRRNSVTLQAFDTGTVPVDVFQGTITDAWLDGQAAPDVPFRVSAHSGLFDAVKPVEPISINGAADVANMLSSLAEQMGLRFENNGVTKKLSNAYYPGTSARWQAMMIVLESGIEWNACENGVLAIWNPGESRAGEIPLISKNTGLENYPRWTSNGILFSTLFNPSIGLGTKVQVESSQFGATGQWVVYKIDHKLESMVPHGRWHSTIEAAPPGLGPYVA